MRRLSVDVVIDMYSCNNLQLPQPFSHQLSEQYKLSLELYNATLALGPFPLADERLQTMECYSSVIQRMEKQNNVLRATLLKLQVGSER